MAHLLHPSRLAFLLWTCGSSTGSCIFLPDSPVGAWDGIDALGVETFRAVTVSALLDASAAPRLPHSGRAGEAVALVVFDKLMVSQALLVNLCAGFVQLGLSALALRLVLGYPRLVFCRFGTPRADLRLLVMLFRDSLAALVQFALVALDAEAGRHE